jgi:hypothetical protein
MSIDAEEFIGSVRPVGELRSADDKCRNQALALKTRLGGLSAPAWSIGEIEIFR